VSTSVSPDRPLRGYVLHDVIGEGAHGRVYEATQPGTDRRVAIKVIRPDLADSAEFVRRFDTEARLVARLEHPHIVPLHDYWREPGGAYLVFRLLTGGTARDAVVRGGPWSLDRVSTFVEEIGGALLSAHAAGVTHNDVKSSNVLLTRMAPPSSPTSASPSPAPTRCSTGVPSGTTCVTSPGWSGSC
jgi:serine/threonine protein kinase